MTRAQYFLAGVIVLLICAHAGAQSPIGDSGIEQQVDEFIASLPDEFNGTILLAIGDTILLNKGYGYADRSFSIRNDSNTMYQLASVSKDFTTILIFKLVEEGLIDLEATIDTYLPEYPKDKAEKITVHQLLLHQSGIKHHFQAIPDYFGGHDLLYHTPREYLQLFWDKELAHEPGEGTTYTSPGYTVLALIMEGVTGRSFAELLREYICEPLDMNNTFVDNNLTTFQNLAIGYKKGINGLVFDLEEVPSNLIGAGDMVSTTGDLFKFQRILDPGNDLVLSKPSKELLFQEQFKINDLLVRTNVATLAKHVYNDGVDTVTQYGIGTGGNYGFRARLTRLLEIDACYIVLSNVHNGRAMNDQMYNFLADILFSRSGISLKTYYPLSQYAPSQTPVTIPTEQLTLYEGIYRTDEDGFVCVFLEGNRLYYRDYVSSVWNRKNVYGGELLSIDGGTFVDNNGWFQRYFVFLIPEQLAADGPYAGLKSLFADIPDTSGYQLVQVKFGAASRAVRWSADDFRSSSGLAEYAGLYYSTELQRTFQFDELENRLIARDFLGLQELSCLPLALDLFYSEKGFLVFHRYDDGTVRDFRLMSENLDHVYGSLFIRK
ncbi:MAG: serine hydrolase [Candidatus Zixiibacteriota bacterium]|nr:MAG: serine hydrolase [candidate division Zixibacteria bacterium]